ncbi:pilus assembly protein PilM [Candidatus Omnitrophota bacterium]
MRKRLGIYFDGDGIAIVQAADRRVLESGFFPYSQPDDESSDGVVSGMKIRNLLEEGMNTLDIKPTDAYVGISDVKSIFRFMEMPTMKKKELQLALPLEAEKYMPFKIEDIAWDYKEKRSFREKKVKVAFTGVKQEVITEITEIFKDLSIPVKSIESASFATVGALVHFNKISRKNKNFAVFILSGKQGEINIFDDNFPYFCRHTKLPLDDEGAVSVAKVVDELRITLDYYRRERGQKSLEKLFVVGKKDALTAFAPTLSELEIDVEKITLEDIVQTPLSSIQELKAYSLALRDFRPPALTFDYLTRRPEASEGGAIALEARDVPWDPRAVFLPLVIGFLAFIAILFIKLNLETSKVVEMARLNKSFNELNMPEHLQTLDSLRKSISRNDFLWQQMRTQAKIPRTSSSFLSLIHESLGPGMWLDSFEYKGDSVDQRARTSFRGMIFLSDVERERDSLGSFIATLKASDLVKGNGLQVNVHSINQLKERGYDVTAFEIRIE